ncbi:MAG: HIT family protein [Candidatus Babeliaceae bacterium]
MQCLFCDVHMDKKRVIKEFTDCFVIEDAFPVSEGHILIISKEHVSDWFSASETLLANVIFALSEMKNFLQKKYNPQGYNIGVNCGESAGQTIMHLHVHLIPRYVNDIDDPRGGVRGVIPVRQKY